MSGCSLSLLTYANRAILSMYSIFALFIIGIGAYHCFPNSEELSLCQQPRDFGFFNGVANILIHHDGRYFANILHSCNPLAFDSIFAYKWMPVITIFSFITAFYIMLLELGSYKHKMDTLILVTVFTFLQLQFSPSLVIQLYEMVGSFVYYWPWIFFISLVSVVIRINKCQKGYLKLVLFILGMAFLFAAIGLSEIFFLPNFLLIATLLVRSYHLDKHRLEFTLLFFFGIGCLLLFVTSPGIQFRINDNRSIDDELVEGAPFLLCIQHNTSMLISIFKNPVWFFASLAIYPMIVKLNFLQQLHTFKRAFSLSIILIGVACFMTLPYYLGMRKSFEIPYRIYSSTSVLVNFAVICLWLVVIKYIIELKLFASARKIICTAPVMASIILLLFITPIFSNNYVSILEEFRAGILTKFDADMRVRIKTLKEVRATNPFCYKSAIVGEVVDYPKSIYNGPDLLPNRGYAFGNEAWEAYFRLDEIRIQGDTAKKFKLP